YLALTAAALTLTTAGLAVGTVTPARAEFEIQEAGLEKGAKELEYRGAEHWGISNQEGSNATEGDQADEGGGDEEEGPLRQSHDLEFEYGLTDRWLFSTAISADEPVDQDFNLSSVELGLQYEFMKRRGDGIAMAIQTEYGFATRGGDPDEFGFGPIVELASGKLLITLHPIRSFPLRSAKIATRIGSASTMAGAQRTASPSWGVGVEMFGQMENLSHAGSFNDQNHSIGPTLFWKPVGGEDEAKNEGGENDNRAAGSPNLELSFNVGVQFGLTDATSDGALKFQGTFSW